MQQIVTNPINHAIPTWMTKICISNTGVFKKIIKCGGGGEPLWPMKAFFKKLEQKSRKWIVT